MVQFSQKVIDYFIYSYDSNTGEKMGGSGFKPDELLKVVRVRSSNEKLKPKVQGGLDYVLFLTKEDKKTLRFVLKWQRQLDNGKYTVSLDHPYIPAGSSLTGANGVTWGKSGVEEIINSDEKQLEVIKWIVGIIERPKGAYKSDFIQDGPWKIIQDPWNPDVTPPQDTGDTVRQVSKFKPEQTFVPQTNGNIKDNSYTKQYKFVIENPPTYPEENNVNAIISVMSLEEFAKENPKDAETLAGSRTITQVVNGVPTFASQQRDLKDNYLSNIEILAIPNQNPKTKGPLDDRNSYVSGSEGSKKIAFTLTKGERIDSIGFNANASVDDFINESLRQSVEVYKQIVYGVLQNPQYTENLEKVFANQLTEEQLKKIYEDLLNLPENKFGLVQTQTSTPEPQTEDPKTEQPNIVEPAKTGKYIFNVGTVSNSGILTNAELGTFSVVNAFLEDNPYQYTDEEILTDDEYSEVSSTDLEESGYEIPSYLIDDAINKISENKNLTTAEKQEIEKELKDSAKKTKKAKPSKNPPASLIQAMKDYGVTNPLEQAHFIAQCAHESGGFSYATEFGGEKYFTDLYENAKRLGNNQPGDGAKFRGRGYIQITGRANYTEYNKYLKKRGINDDVVKNPELLATKYAADCSLWFWSVLGPDNNKDFPTRSRKGSSTTDINKIGGWINGKNPPNGADDRIEKFNYYWSVLQNDGKAYS